MVSCVGVRRGGGWGVACTFEDLVATLAESVELAEGAEDRAADEPDGVVAVRLGVG